jgi:Ca-activated chloride channel family protein
MSFRWPYMLLALPLILAALLALLATGRRARQRLLAQFAAARLLPVLLASYSPTLRRVKNILLVTGALLVTLALARPQWGYQWQEQHARGVDVVFVLDTSRSMLTEDVQPNRIERAKLAIYDSLEKLSGNRVGLVAFAGDAFLQCPLTLDYDAFRQTLDSVDTHTISQGGTDIAAGLDEAAAALEKSGNHKIIVLLTDGDDLEGQGIDDAKRLAAGNVTVYTVGVGTPQGDIIPIRDAQGRQDFVRDENGQIVKSSLDSKTLTSIAEATGGFYQPLGATGEGLARVFDEGIKKIPQQDLTSQMERQPIEQFQWPLGIGLLLLALESLIGTRRPSWSRQAISTVNLAEPPPILATTKSKSPTPRPNNPAPTIAAVILLGILGFFIGSPRAAAQTPPAPGPAANITTSPADSAPAAASASVPASSAGTTNTSAKSYSAMAAEDFFKKGDYKSAAEAYGQVADADPNDWRFRYDQGASLYREGDYESAAKAFTQTLGSGNFSLQQGAYYNLGNTQYRLGQDDLKQDPKKTVSSWEDAIKAYQNALELNSNDNDARYNLGLVQKELDELKKQLDQQQKQQQQNQQNQPDQQNKQDQQNQQNQSQNSSQNQNQNQQNKQDQQNQQNQSQNSPQNQQNNQNQQNQNQSNQNQNQNQSGSKGDQSQNSSSSQNQGGQKNPSNGSQANPSNGNQNQSPQKSPGNPDQQQQAQNNPSSSGQKPDQQNPGSDQKQAENAQSPKPATTGQNGNQNQAQSKPGTEPGDQKSGQNPATAANSGGNATASGDQAGGNQTAVIGVMTQEEARQILDSLKASERKLPASRMEPQNPNAKPANGQSQKDW